MSTIFTTQTNTTTRPRPDATIRVEIYKMPPGAGMNEPKQYRAARLLEFHPDHDNRLKFRGYALIEREEWVQHPAYEVQGAGFLEQPYVYVREFMIHEDDRRELIAYCDKFLSGNPLRIRPQPVPFPMFRKDTRVVVVEYKDAYDDTTAAGQIGKLATVTEQSSPGGRTTIRFDDAALNRGFTAVGLPSIALREIQEGYGKDKLPPKEQE